MSGHSKWSTIKRKKGAADQKRGKIYTRIIHEITIAVKEGGGGDPAANPRLRFAVDKAKSVNMPNENISRAIKRATGEEKGAQATEQLIYEGYGPGGTAVFLEVMTDNKNRTVSEIRHAFSRCGGALGENGCVAWMFDKKGLITIAKAGVSEEEIMEIALESGADDVTDEGDVWEITCDPKVFNNLRSVIQAKYILEDAEVEYLPKTRIELEGKEAEQMMRLLEMLEDLDDVVNVASNCDFKEGTI